MSSRASGGALAACLITAAIIGFAGGAYIGTQTGNASSGSNDSAGENGSAAPDDDQADGDGGDAGGTEPTDDASSDAGLTLALDDPAQAEVTPGDCVNVHGALNPPVAKVKVQLQRSVEGGDWEQFPSIGPWTTNENGEFGGFACSQREGVNALRVVRSDDESVVSDPIEVTIG
ncbi:hypothetical protein [Haloactinopolyspora sp.]|uniref:hypothetical protein n=1 Tax=Haloactinopolyspora sp. TaxID=1966353 RepID=UPI002631AC84|nr:hypothetical protein [Haloactinopolyspora sp.]